MVMDSFGAAGDWGPCLCSALPPNIVGLPFHAGLEGAGDIG